MAGQEAQFGFEHLFLHCIGVAVVCRIRAPNGHTCVFVFVCVCLCLRLCVCFEGCLLRASGAGRCSSSHGSSDGRRERWGEESEGPNRFRDVTAMAESGQASQQTAGRTEGGLAVKICESENSDVEMGSS